MIKKKFTESHLSLAHSLWKEHINVGDIALDCTCGNGKDSFFLANLGSQVHAIDIQEEALINAKALLQDFPITFYHQSHETLPPLSPRLIIYNLGYLPGGNHNVTTQTSSTLQSIENALSILTDDGMITITCYPGHPEGKKEEEALLHFLPSHTIYYKKEHPTAPSLFFIKKCLY